MDTARNNHTEQNATGRLHFPHSWDGQNKTSNPYVMSKKLYNEMMNDTYPYGGHWNQTGGRRNQSESAYIDNEYGADPKTGTSDLDTDNTGNVGSAETDTE